MSDNNSVIETNFTTTDLEDQNDMTTTNNNAQRPFDDDDDDDVELVLVDNADDLVNDEKEEDGGEDANEDDENESVDEDEETVGDNEDAVDRVLVDKPEGDDSPMPSSSPAPCSTAEVFSSEVGTQEPDEEVDTQETGEEMAHAVSTNASNPDDAGNMEVGTVEGHGSDGPPITPPDDPIVVPPDDVGIAPPDNSNITLAVGPPQGRGIRLVIASVGRGELHRDTFNTDSSDARKKFLRALAGKLGRPIPAEDDLEADLVRRADEADAEAERIRAEAARPPADRPAVDPLTTTPASVREAAEQFLRNPHLMDELAGDLRRLGVVGERLLSTTLYIVGTSRLLPKPLGAVIQSASSSGKSYTSEAVVDLMPPERVLKATDMTPQSLYYMPSGRLKHTLVFLAERRHVDVANDPTGAANSTLAFREMLSSGRLTKVTTERSDDGMISREINQEGPIALIQTTTQETIFAEDETRLLPLATDESAEQTQRVIAFQATSAAGDGSAAEEQAAIRAKHHAVQRLLQELHVCIPFAELLTIPTSKVSARRAFGQLLACISAVSLLRQFQKQAVNGRIDADAEDYAIAHGLMLPVLRRVFTPLKPRARELYSTILASRPNPTLAATFTRKECERWSGLSLTEVGNRLKLLVEAGLVEVTDAPRGNPYRYRISSGITPETLELDGLITPAELRQRLANDNVNPADQVAA